MKSLKKYMNNSWFIGLITQGDKMGLKLGVILRLLGFGVVSIIGLHPNEAQIGDLTIELNNNFITNFMHKHKCG
jgi:hypothetical protein